MNTFFKNWEFIKSDVRSRLCCCLGNALYERIMRAYASIYRLRARNACVRTSSWAAIIMRWELSHASRIRTQEQRHRTFSSSRALLFHSLFILFHSFLCRHAYAVGVRSGSNGGRMAVLRSGYYSRFDAIVMSASGASALPSPIVILRFTSKRPLHSTIHFAASVRYERFSRAPFDRALTSLTTAKQK